MMVQATTSAPAMPFSLEAEQGLLGVMLLYNETIQKVDGLEARHFYEPLHAALWGSLKAKASAGVVFDPTVLASEFASSPAFAELGGLSYFNILVDRAPPSHIAPEYARLIVDTAHRRELIRAADAMRAGAMDAGVSVSDIVGEAERTVVDIARGAEPGDANLVDARTAVEDTLREFRAEAALGRPKGMMTGLRCIDRRLRGLRPGHLIVMAGRPSMGKSGLARQAFKGAAERNPEYQFPFFCLEMHRREMSERTLSEISYRQGQPLAYRDMNPEKMSPMELDRLDDLVWHVPKNFILDDTPTLSLEYIRRRVWALKRKGKVGAVGIDYLQIMKRPEAKGRNDAAVIGEITAGLKVLAREAECAVVLLSQINRGVEARDDKRPQLSDLRESGAIEQDANAVLFPYREVYYLERAEPREGTPEHMKWEEQVEILKRRMEVLCAKNRGGAVGSDVQDYFAEYDAVNDVREG